MESFRCNRNENGESSSSEDPQNVEASTCPQHFPQDTINASSWKSNHLGLLPAAFSTPDTSKMNTLIVCAFMSTLALIYWVRVRQEQTQSHRKNCQDTPIQELMRKRKRDFLSRAGAKYGYQNSLKGFIDTWRNPEFPSLVTSCTNDDKPSLDNATTAEESNNVHEVYLDYAGAALPSLSQQKRLLERHQNQILANPHSSGPAAARTLQQIKEAEAQVLEFLGATSGRFASRLVSSSIENSSSKEYHPGYDIVFTSGTSESLRIVAERFHFPVCSKCQSESTLLYSQNAHTSVIGMRGPAQAHRAKFECQQLQEIEDRYDWNNPLCLDCECRNLLVFPMECNFGGTRANSQQIIQSAHLSGKWSVLLDIAKAASTGPVNLKELDPDFACLSFYKLFGTPTGLGALLIKRNPNDHPLSTSSVDHHYFGGGSVNLILPRQNVTIPRTDLSASLSHGTMHFRGIISLQAGFEDIEHLGGMKRIQEHTSVLAKELASRLKRLLHGNGKPVISFYGAWKDVDDHNGRSRGPTVTFNVLRYDGSFVGYNEVSKLASLNRPPIQFRTGCFCNPGACQEALGYSDDNILTNYQASGHVCGDHIDLVDGKPTGAVRISFGKDSTWEDLDCFCTFLEESFLNDTIDLPTNRNLLRESPSVTEGAISELYIFPIKSCAAQRVRKWRMEFPCGKLAFDREFALVDSSGTAIRLQSCPKMGLIKPTIDIERNILTVSAPGCPDLVVDLNEDGPKDHGMCDFIHVCGNKCGGRLWGDHETSEWFSKFLGIQCWLARYLNGSYQFPQNSDLSSRDPLVAFANEQPILLVADNAVGLLNKVLKEQHQATVTSKHFRPNIVLSCSTESNWMNFEDEWNTLEVKDKGVRLNAKGSCARCAMVDFCPSTGRKVQTLRALASYRRHQGRILFGTFFKGSVGCDSSSQAEFILEEGDEVICS